MFFAGVRDRTFFDSRKLKVLSLVQIRFLLRAQRASVVAVGRSRRAMGLVGLGGDAPQSI